MPRIFQNLVFQLRSHSKRFFNNRVARYADLNVGTECTIYNTELSGKIQIGREAFIHSSILRGNISVGDNTAINGPSTIITAKHHPILIGNYCSIAHNVTIIEYNHQIKNLSTCFLQKRFGQTDSRMKDTSSKGPIEIGHDVWIGAGAVILSGVKIGNGAVVGANSVVNTDVHDFEIVGGNPAKQIKMRFPKEFIEELNELCWWDYSLKELKKAQEVISEPLDLNRIKQIKQCILSPVKPIHIKI